ncbi:MAG TPA: sulfite exporter TauE/SafE family protein [Burkholderiales bacterium]|jgi:uncharacterized membrane protein YfcA|nr:sulfite exporter TauE/SafE family protein [Burkholderiales bacterium]
MEALGTSELLFAMVVVTVAFAVRGTTGFGGNAIAVPLLTLILPINAVLAVMTVLTVFSSLGHWIMHWRRIVWREIARVAPFMLAGVVLGLYLFKALDTRTVTRFLGGFVILYAVFAMATAKRTVSPPRSWLWPLATMLSALAGLVGTLFGGVAGPLYAIYLNTLELDKDRFRVTITTILMVQALLRIAGYYTLGFYDRATVLLLIAGLPLVWAGSRIGDRIALNIDQHTFNAAVGAVLMVSGAVLLFK